MAAAKQEHRQNLKDSQELYDVSVQELLCKDILDNVRKFYKAATKRH